MRGHGSLVVKVSDRGWRVMSSSRVPPKTHHAPPIENPADCEVRAVIRFLCAQGFKSIDIHHQISEVYGENIMSDGMVRKWFSAFKDGRTHIHDEERSGKPSVITDELIQKVDCKVKENR
ncbi:HTH_48 domain-containing protein [Trichonephila clavipes]|uniref:HTH_48 domain-containing protein n=1 Tax=Trichonephila clavipes TaxID=2585209 RepID=A0A8X6T612_TRICX|nr:HTH_48 domain-containing protein [Trichonephila clavipes]